MLSKTTAILLSAVAMAVHGAESDGLPFEKALDLHWSGIALGLQYYGSDYTGEEPFILIQRLPDDRWLVSEQPIEEKQFSKPIAFLSEKGRRNLVEALRSLPKIDSGATFKNSDSGVIITVQILGYAAESSKDEYKFIFSSPNPAADRYLTLLKELGTPNLNED